MFDIYSDVSSAINNREPSFLELLDEHLDLNSLIPVDFYRVFYKYTGRKLVYSLESFIRFFLLQKFIGIDKASAMLLTLSVCQEMRDFCGFTKLPDAAKITRFKQDFSDHLENFFNRLVDITEPICRELDEKKAGYLIFLSILCNGIHSKYRIRINFTSTYDCMRKQQQWYQNKNVKYNRQGYIDHLHICLTNPTLYLY